ncbi:MAG: hypothetical protein AAF458_09070 [Pseudomonadota bacterium]
MSKTLWRIRLCILVLTSLAVVGAQACIPREATQPTDPGPHDYSDAATSSRLWQEDDPGEPLFLRIRVLNTCGDAVAGASVQVLHANQDGDHEFKRWRTRIETDARGGASLLTVFPGYTGGIPRHIHFVIRHPGHKELITRLFFKNDPDIDHSIEDLAMVLEQVDRNGRRGWVAGFEFVIDPK